MIEMQLNNRAKAIEYLDYALRIAHQRKYVMGIYILLQRLGTIKVSYLINALFPETDSNIKEDGDSHNSEVHFNYNISLIICSTINKKWTMLSNYIKKF